MTEKQSVLAVKDLTVELDGQIIIEKLNFEVAAGEYLTIIGPNGAGKTTLFRALINILPHSGVVRWSSDAVLGYVPQKLDIERNVPLSLRDFLESKNTSAKRNTEFYLQTVNLALDFLNKPISSLSGGEFQRALVAFALIGNTNVLLFDEPTVGIDKPSEEQIYETLHRLQDEKNLTIIAISHDISLVNRYADKVLCLNKQKVCYGAPAEVLQAEKLADIYGANHKFFHHIHDAH